MQDEVWINIWDLWDPDHIEEKRHARFCLKNIFLCACVEVKNDHFVLERDEHFILIDHHAMSDIFFLIE